MMRGEFVEVAPLPSGQWVAEPLDAYYALRVVRPSATAALIALCDALLDRMYAWRVRPYDDDYDDSADDE